MAILAEHQGQERRGQRSRTAERSARSPHPSLRFILYMGVREGLSRSALKSKYQKTRWHGPTPFAEPLEGRKSLRVIGDAAAPKRTRNR